MAVDNGNWDGGAAMSTCANADDPAAAYAKVCAGRRAGDPSLQSSWALPHHMSPMMGPNADGVRNALSRLPQTQGLTNHDAAQAHLDAHMAEIQARSEDEPTLLFTDSEATVEMRSEAKRELDIRIVPFNTVITHQLGPEMFERGAFADVDPRKVLLKGPDSDGSHRGPVVGKGVSLEERDDGAYMTFKVSKTSHGDELLTLVADDVVKGASIGFAELPGGTAIQQRDGRRLRVQQRVALDHVVATWRPAYERAAVVAMRSKSEEEATSMADQTQAVVEAAPEPVPQVNVDAIVERMNEGLTKMGEAFTERIAKLEERARSSFEIPAPVKDTVEIKTGQWMEFALKMLSGERIPDMQYREVADLVTSDNVGVVPPQYLQELIGVIDPSRPFMASTRRLNTPSAGMSLVVPVITQRPTVAEQSTEKTELSSQATKISTKTFDMVTKGGVGDISLQLLKRADRSFLDLYLQLLAEAYAIEADAEAVAALIDAIGNVQSANALDPNDLELGDAFATSFDAIRRPPDTIWLSTLAMSAFIDAKATTTNQPLYSSLRTEATAGGGIRGSISGLNAVHVPALDAHGAYAIVGPSSGFAWAEDGTYTIQVDVPAKAGRDVALVGMLWFAPWYPDAFSLYNVASGS